MLFRSRYFTDVVTEMDLANSFNEDGSVRLHADGYPLSTRTDIMMSIYDTPAPSNQELEKRIMMNAPVDWLKLQEDIKNPDVNTKLSQARNLTGESKSFTTEELTSMKDEVIKTEEENNKVAKAYDTVLNLMDSLKILAAEEPQMIRALAEVINDVRKIAEE